MKIVIFYKSILGSAKQYALWLSEAVSGEAFTFTQFSKEKIYYADVVVVISGTYAARMPLISFLQKNWKQLKAKKIVVIAVGIAPATDEQSLKSYNLIPSEIKEKIIYFKLPGKLFSAGPAGEPSKDKLKQVIAEIKKTS